MAFRTVAAAHDLDLFTRLSGTGGSTPEELSAQLDVAARPAEMLLTACAALGLLEKRRGRYRNSPLAENFLVRGKPYYLGAAVEMYDKRLYPAWARLSQAISTNRPTTWEHDQERSLFETEDPSMLAMFWEAMHCLSLYTARLMGEALDFNAFNRLLDVGGGSGAYDVELCRRYPHLRATVYDLPFVAEIAAEKVSQAGMSDRIAVLAGDFFAEPRLPEGHDVCLLAKVLHDWQPDKNRALLRKCHQALPAGGCLIISEVLVNDQKTGPPGAALQSLCMLVETEGRNYTAAEYAAWLQETGFSEIRTIPLGLASGHGVVVARKP